MRLAVLLAALACAALTAALPASPGYITYDSLGGAPYKVTSDKRSFLINGQRTLFLSAGLHYPRFTPAMWEDLLLKVKADGYNMIQTYVFWNAHQHKQDILDFNGGYGGGIAGSYNLTGFLDVAKTHGLFVTLRIGPYVCAEWNFGGYPVWIRGVDNLVTRTSSPGWEAQMQAFFNATVAFYKQNGYFADEGGPIALAQVENELHTNDQAYIAWCGELAAAQPVTIPWLMCNGDSAKNTINSCNSGDCTGFIEENGQNGRVLIDQPAAWTENWSPWYQTWQNGGDQMAAYNGLNSAGEASGKAFGLGKWYARGGSHSNFYMSSGGNNYQRMAGASTQPQYYTGSQYQPDALSNEPFRSHTAAFFAALVSIAGPVLNNPAQVHKQVNLSYIPPSGSSWEITGKQYAYLYGTPFTAGSAVFIQNDGGSGIVQLASRNFTINGGSILLINEAGTVVFDTSAVPPSPLARSWTPISSTPFQWEYWTESPFTSPEPQPGPTPYGGSTVGTLHFSAAPIEQLNLTADDTEHAYYTVSVPSSVLLEAERASVSAGGSEGSVALIVGTGRATALTAFFPGDAPTSGYEISENAGAYSMNLTLSATSALAYAAANPAGAVNLTILSESLGIHKFASVDNFNGVYTTTAVKGVMSATLGGVSLTELGWTARSGLVGESAQVWTSAGSKSVQWTPANGALTGAPLTWFRTTFVSPDLSLLIRQPGGGDVNASLQFNSTGFSRGHFYVNEYEISRSWPAKTCGSEFCQFVYHIPPDVLNAPPALNTLTVWDVEGATDLSVPRLVLTKLAPPPPCTMPSQAAGANLSTWICSADGSPAESFKFTPVTGNTGTVVLESQSLCWAVGGNNPITNSPAITLEACNATSPAQHWTFPPAGTSGPIVSASTGRCVDVPNEGRMGLELDLWSCNNGGNQQWAYNVTTGLVSGWQASCIGVCIH